MNTIPWSQIVQYLPWIFLPLMIVYILHSIIFSFVKPLVDPDWTADAKVPHFYEFFHLAPQSHLQNKSSRKSPVLLVIAHPDDESMFFIPTITQLKKSGIPVHILCMSKGNYDGIGGTRMNEFRESCKLLGVRCIFAHSLEVFLDRKTEPFPDGPNTSWPIKDFARALATVFVAQKSPLYQTIITFDAEGISGHKNHINCFHGVSYFLQHFYAYCPIALSPPLGLALETTSIFRKFIGWFDILFSYRNYVQHHALHKLRLEEWLLRSSKKISHSPKASDFPPPPPSPLMTVGYKSSLTAFQSMKKHKSQFVWFRKLFHLFSRYTVINTLVPIYVTVEPPPQIRLGPIPSVNYSMSAGRANSFMG